MKPLDHRALRSVQEAPSEPPPGEELQQALDAIPHMVWVHVPGRDDQEYYNRQWLDFTGVAMAPDGTTRRALIHPDDRRRAMAAWARARATGEPYEAEYRLRHRSGEYRWILSRGRPCRGDDGTVRRWYGTCTEIHERVLAREALAASEGLVRSIVEASGDCIKMIGPDGRIRFLNKAARAELKLRGEADPIGCEWIATLPAQARPLARKALDSAVAGRMARFTTIRHLDDGANEWRDYAVTQVRGEDGGVGGLVVSSRDVTDERLVRERLRWTANHDLLTDLPNRAYFHDCLQEAIRQAGPAGAVGLLIVDVDNLKQMNDALGHDAGDALIQEFARRLREAVEPHDVVGRLGGDEFGIVLTALGGTEALAAAADAIIDSLRRPFVHDGRLLDCRGSIGASLYPQQGADKAELMKAADLALYVAKAAGRTQWVLFDPAMRAEMQNRVSTLALTRDALEEERIVPYYQAKVDLRTGAVDGFEALLRWRDRRGRLQLPATIAAAFDDAVVSAAISERILGCAIADICRWREAGIAFGHVAINVTATDFRNGDLAERVLGALERAAIPPSCLQIEVTETVFLGRGAEYVETALKRLSAAGVRIALDDFGTGFASLSHLKRFPVDVLKIDRSFVTSLATSRGDAAIIEGIINMSRSLGIEVVAEGVETAVQRRFLADHGCHYGQGFLFGRAMAAARIPTLLGRETRRAA